MENREKNVLTVFDAMLDKLEKHWNELAVDPLLKKHKNRAMSLILEATMLRDAISVMPSVNP